MTESEWLASDDPVAMLAVVTSNVTPRPPARRLSRPSDRKLRLFACAVARQRPSYRFNDPAWLTAIRIGEDVADGAPMPIDRPMNVGGGDLGPLITAELGTVEASILRDIVGNPFEEWWVECDDELFLGREVAKNSLGTIQPIRVLKQLRERINFVRRSWLTPDVVALAHAAYYLRGRACLECKGTGKRWHPDGGCYACDSTGRIDDGTLDPARLAVLSDALEEAGCCGEECHNCVDGDIGCAKCEGAGYFYAPAYSLNRIKCTACNEGLLPEKCTVCDGSGRMLHPLLAHLRSPGPHYRGCWVIDLILGKS